MTEFIVEILKISRDGVFNINEAIVIAIALVVLLLVLVLLKDPLVKLINRYTPGRKKTIFSHRKNQYKNSIGKKSKADKKRK